MTKSSRDIIHCIQKNDRRFSATTPCFQSNLLVHSARGIFMPLQHLQPGPCPEVAENRFLNAESLVVFIATLVDIIGKLKEARGDFAPQPGQITGNSYSAMGRKSENEPQRGHS